MTDNQPDVSVFIPTKNAGPSITLLLEAVFRQKDVAFEVIIVDSGSSDDTLRRIAAFPTVRLHRILPEDFGHGKTRNLAAKYANGRCVAFLSQDAIPADEHWLKPMIEDFELPGNEKIVGIYSRQIAPESVPEYEKYWIKENYGDAKIRRSGNLSAAVPGTKPSAKPAARLEDIFFSNVSSCIRKDILLKYPFDDSIIMSEDQAWAKSVLEAGYTTLYEPASKVTHGHSYTLMQTVRRYFDSAYSLQQILGPQLRQFSKKGRGYMTAEFLYILKNRPTSAPALLLHDIAKIEGTFLGLHARYLPKSLKRFFSMHSYYWK